MILPPVDRDVGPIIVAISRCGADRAPQPSPFDGHLTKPVELGRLLRMLADIPSGEHTAPQKSQIHGQPEKWSDP
jgi:hypothetical protein